MIRDLMDYDLSRLSSRSFEQLVQALSVRHFGPGVVIFGDGADGGREATFQGASSFAPHGDNWDGSCVIQAKFRQRPLGTEIDGPWAINSLKDELNKFAKQLGGRPRPHYFIFVTNAVLSPGTDGTKDQAIEILDAARDDWGLRDYDIWDFDKLRTWLDIDEEVRTRFGWITAGDVLAEMLRSMKHTNPAFDQAIVNYLEKTLIADRFVRLEEAGHSAEEPTALSNVFVDLPITGDPTGDGLFMRHLLEHTSTLKWHRSSDEWEARQRMVLVGGPGQGKTTLGQFACQIFRASLLAERPSQSLSLEGLEAIAAVQAACDAAKLPFRQGPRFPIRVVLTDLAKALTEHERPLLVYLTCLISERVGTSVSTDLFREWLSTYPWFLVLDGLDEVPANAGREKVMRCITEFWVDAAQANADIVVLATTRPQGYNNDFSPDRHRHVLLAELTPDLALDYGSRLAETRYGINSDRTNIVKTRLSRAASDPTTAHLMRSPLQVAIMTALVDRYGQPPHERWSLFDAYYDVIYQRERERDTDAATILREDRPDVDAIHQRVGLALQVLTTHEGHSDPRLTTAQLEQIIDARLASEGHEGPGTSVMAASIRSAAELRLVFLVGAESDRIGFEIRSLQEFMAAGALVDGPDNQVVARLAAIAPLPSWRNVLLFAAGQCFVRKQHLRAQLHTLCRELDIDTDEPLLTATKTGARLALDLLEDRTARRQPKHHRLIAAHALEVLDVPDDDAPFRLARCHDDKVDDLYQTAITDALASSDEIRCTNARRCLVALSDASVDWAQPLLHNHLPTTSVDVVAMLDGLDATMIRSFSDGDIATCVELLDHHQISALTSGVLRDYAQDLRWANRRDRRRDISFGELPGLRFSVFSIAPGHTYARQSPEPDDAQGLNSPTIVVYRAIERFLEDPSSDHLASVLIEIAHQSTPEIWRQCAYSVPWPMGIHLCQADSVEQLISSCEDVLNGAHGDLADWLVAEERWATDQHRLVDGLLSELVPFPIEVAGATITPTERRQGLPWLDDFSALPDDCTRQRTVLANLMLWAMGFPGQPDKARPRMSDVIKVAQAAAQTGRQWVGLGILDASMDDPSELIALLEALSPDTRFTYYRESDAVNEVSLGYLERYARDSPSSRGLETLAFALASSSRFPKRAISPPINADDHVGYASAAYIAFVSGNRSTSARELGRIFATDFVSLQSLLASPLTQAVADWSQFLAGIHDSSPRKLQELANIDRLMNEMISRRGTSLAETTTWRDLGLFEPHPLTLTD